MATKRAVLKPHECIKAFVLRARRITAHSLLRDHQNLMERARGGQFKFWATKNVRTNETSYELIEDLPPEELVESLAARIRPLILPGDGVHFSKVLDAIGELVPADSFPDYLEPLDFWRSWWESVTARDNTAQAYMMITDQGAVSDRALMYAWLYGDLVHADDVEFASVGLGVSERYKAAVGIVARIAENVEQTLLLIRVLVDEGLLQVPSELFERQVIVTETSTRTAVKPYRAEVGGRMPTDLSSLDPEIWQPTGSEFEPDRSFRSDCLTCIRQIPRRPKRIGLPPVIAPTASPDEARTSAVAYHLPMNE